MRRVLVTLATAGLLIAGGCGSKSYDARLESTIADMKYQKRLNDNLMPPVAKNKFEQLLIYLRPPQKLEQTKEFALIPDVPPGRFDLESSFWDPATKQYLHVLGRVKPSKTAAKKKGAPTPADTAARGDFTKDVLALINTVYPNLDLATTKLKAEERGPKKIPYKWTGFSTEDKTIWIYFYKKDPYDVALIFESPTSQKSGLTSKLDLCLGSFAVGPRAQRLFAGQGAEEEVSVGGAAPGAGTPF